MFVQKDLRQSKAAMSRRGAIATTVVALNIGVLATTGFTFACVILNETNVLVAAALLTLSLTIVTTVVTITPRIEKEKVRWWEKYYSFLMTPVVACLAYRLGTLDVFVVAWGVTPWIFLLLYLIDEAGLVAYSLTPATFLLSRMLFYASIRSGVVAMERHADAPRLLGRIALPLAGAVETSAMFLNGIREKPKLWYNFPVKSMEFASYALVKSAWLLSLPLLEEHVVSALTPA